MEKQPVTVEPHFWNKLEFQIEFIPIEDKDSMPDLPWGGVYAIGNLDGKVPVVKYPENIEYPFGLPGGHSENGETIEQALNREIKEELNMTVKYALCVYAVLEKDGEWCTDVGGCVIGYDLIDISEVAPKVKKGQRMDYMTSKVKGHFNS